MDQEPLQQLRRSSLSKRYQHLDVGRFYKELHLRSCTCTSSTFKVGVQRHKECNVYNVKLLYSSNVVYVQSKTRHFTFQPISGRKIDRYIQPTPFFSKCFNSNLLSFSIAKTLSIHRFSDVFRGFRKRPVT